MSRFIKTFIKLFLLSFLILILLFLNASFQISRKLGKPNNYIIKTLYQASQSNPYLSKDNLNFIILGLDERNDSLEVTQTTDTIIFASLNLHTYKLTIISLPRDLWFYDIDAKINQIYPMSFKENEQFPFIKKNFQKITGQEIDHVIVLKTDDLITFVNLIEGVDLNLDIGFTDNQYPNPDYIANPSSDIPLYKTITFESGPLHLDESNVTEFVRSRHGGETAAKGGTDIARIHRQQLLIEAILNKLKSAEFIPNESQLIDLYNFWQNISKDINDVNAIQIISTINSGLSQIKLNRVEIEVGSSIKDGIIYHPTTFTNKQWVYLPSSSDYQIIHDFIKNSIQN